MSKIKQSSEIAIDIFDAAHAVAIKEYKKFWMDFFAAYGFKAIPNREDSSWWATFEMSFNGKEFICEVRPAHFTGVKIWEKGHYGSEKKIMTSNDAVNWMKTNNIGNPPMKKI